MTERIKKGPSEVNSFEFLSEHLYQRAEQGGSEEEFNRLKTVLPYLNQFERLTDLMDLMEQGDENFANYLLVDLIKLYRANRELRPAVVIIIILILWKDLTEIYEDLPEWQGYDERFAEIYWDILNRLKKFKSEEITDIKAEIIIRLRANFITEELVS